MDNLNKLAVKQSEERNKMSRTSQQSESQKVGQRLYSLGVNMKENKMRKSVKFLKQQQISECATFTYSPQINNKSFSKLRSENQDDLGKKAEEKLIEYGKKYDKHIENQRSKLLKQEQMECSFQPTVNERSKILKTKQNSRSQAAQNKVHETLYAQAKKRDQVKAEQIKIAQEENLFKPNLSQTEHFKSVQSRKGNVANRLHYFQKCVDEKIEKKREEIEKCMVNPETNQQLFKPQILRGPKNTKSIVYDKNKPRQEALYELHSQRVNKFELLAKQQYQEFRLMKNLKPSNIKSQQMIDRNKKQKYKKIFDILDSDKDGQISKEKMDLSTLENLNSNLVKTMQPILNDIGQKAQTLDFQEFSNTLDTLYNTLNIDQKQNLLGTQKKKVQVSKEDIESTFKPKTNINNLSPRNSESLYQRMNQFLQRHNDKIKQKQEEKQKQELNECSFYPAVKNPSKPKKALNNFVKQHLVKFNPKIKMDEIISEVVEDKNNAHSYDQSDAN